MFVKITKFKSYRWIEGDLWVEQGNGAGGAKQHCGIFSIIFFQLFLASLLLWDTRLVISIETRNHTWYLSQTPQTCLCKNFLSGVNFSRLSEKKCIYLTFSETFLVFLVPLVVFLGVKFGFRKSCLCKRNDKYEVWLDAFHVRKITHVVRQKSISLKSHI